MCPSLQCLGMRAPPRFNDLGLKTHWQGASCECNEQRSKAKYCERGPSADCVPNSGTCREAATDFVMGGVSSLKSSWRRTHH